MPIYVTLNIASNRAGVELNSAKTNLSQATLHVALAADKFSRTIQSDAPRKTGRLADDASRVESTWRHWGGAVPGDVMSIGVGPFSLLGFPTFTAPRGMIAAFVRKNPGLRGTVPASPRGAWWALSADGKKKLATDRLAGSYGSYGGKPRYWQAIHQGDVPTRVGGVLHRNPFIDNAHRAAEHDMDRADRLLR